MSRVVFCVVGMKGAEFCLSTGRLGLLPNAIVSYSQSGDIASFEKIKGYSQDLKVPYREERRPSLLPGDLAYFVGWQFLMEQSPARVVVFHDSLLPKYRGFAPTVAALIAGESHIGVSAISPVRGVDEGRLFGQKSFPVSYPMKIADALVRQGQSMAELAVDIHRRWCAGELRTTEQQGEATYSIWRDDIDYEIDWTQAASQICRQIHATGTPYKGARTRAGGAAVTIHEASVVDDLAFVQRHPGKIWRLEGGRPIVICGEGLLRIDRATREDGSLYLFEKLRTRLTAAPAALSGIS